MNTAVSSSHLSSRWQRALHLLFGITLVNYLAQIPYYQHFYAVHHVQPSIFSIIFLGSTFVLFLVGYIYTLKSQIFGAWLLLVFLALEFGGYLLHNLTGAFLNDLPLNDLLFTTVSIIGYVNFAASLAYLIFILKDRTTLLRPKKGQ